MSAGARLPGEMLEAPVPLRARQRAAAGIDDGSRLTVLHVVGGLGFGGTERLCLNLVACAARQGGRSIVASLDPSRTGMEPAFEALPRTRVMHGPGRRHRDALGWTAGVIRRELPDAIFVYAFGVTHLVVAVAAKGLGVPVFVSAGNPPPDGRGRWKWRAILLASRLLGIPIRSCSACVEGALKELGVGLPRGSSVVPNGSDVAEIGQRADAVRAVRNAGGPFTIGMCARLDPIKDHATLIRALGRIIREHRTEPVELRLLGGGALRLELEGLARAEGIESSVRFLGHRTDVAELLGQMDLYVFSTTSEEGFGIALVEAMAAGLPVVASDVPACREVIGEAGVLVAPGDDAALAAVIVRMIGSDETRKRLGTMARQRAERFDVAACAAAWYGSLARSEPGPAK